MKVKNIVFSGFMAMVLAGACGAANAEIIVASKEYVDTKVTSLNTKDTELSGKITALENANADGGSVANAIAEAKQVGTNAQGAVDALAEKMDLTSADSDLSQALATKENTANKITTTDATYFTNGKVAEGALTTMASDNTNFPTIATAVEIADAKAQDVLTKVNANAGNLSTITANVEKLMGADTVAGSVAYQVKQEETRAMAAEAQVLTDAKAYTDAAATATDGTLSGGFVKQYVDDQIKVLQGNDGLGGIQEKLGQQQEEIDGLGEALEAEVLRATAAEQKIATYDENGNLTGGSVKANAEAIAGLADGAVKDNADAIAAINDDTTGILATAKAYTNTEMEKFYANAETCVTSSESNNCIMSAKLDAQNNVQYVWISLTSPAE